MYLFGRCWLFVPAVCGSGLAVGGRLRLVSWYALVLLWRGRTDFLEQFSQRFSFYFLFEVGAVWTGFLSVGLNFWVPVRGQFGPFFWAVQGAFNPRFSLYFLLAFASCYFFALWDNLSGVAR